MCVMGGKRPGRGALVQRSASAGLAADRPGVGPRRHPAELGMRPGLVVIAPPSPPEFAAHRAASGERTAAAAMMPDDKR